ncbi:MAG: hypothetical protein HY063_02955 [Bacteroidetes bacterium]|nr:hypothetical protein [Bacteroidota bacterium]
MTKFFISLLMMSALVMLSRVEASAQAPKKMPLDGQKFIAEIKEEGKKKPWEPDEVAFNSGKFKCPIFADQGWGFEKAGKYQILHDSTTADGQKVYSWMGDLVNEQNEKLSWSGTIMGDAIEGNIELINKKGKTEKNFAFTGKLKKKPGQKP